MCLNVFVLLQLKENLSQQPQLVKPHHLVLHPTSIGEQKIQMVSFGSHLNSNAFYFNDSHFNVAVTDKPVNILKETQEQNTQKRDGHKVDQKCEVEMELH